MEYQAIRRCRHSLKELIQHDYHDLASSLLSKGLISVDTESKTRLNSTGAEIANTLLANVESTVEVEPRLYSDFLEALGGSYYNSVRDELERVRDELERTRNELEREFEDIPASGKPYTCS